MKMTEIDLERGGAQHDLSDPDVQDNWIQEVKQYHIVLATPESSNFSRAHWNPNGPPPIRSAMYPRGFPWLHPKMRAVAEMRNSLITFAWKVLAEVESVRKTQVITALLEHPEDLGRLQKGSPSDVPASIWRWEEFKGLVRAGWWSSALLQCSLGAPTAKPTRLAMPNGAMAAEFPLALPQFCERGFYMGPVVACDHNHVVSLVRTAPSTAPFRSRAAAAYPSEMCALLARKLLLPSDGEVVKQAAATNLAGSTELAKATALRSRLQVLQRDASCKAAAQAVLSDVSQSLAAAKGDPVEGVDFVKAGWWGVGPPLRILKGPNRPGRLMQDGGGLCSPGRWPPGRRTLPPRGAQIQAVFDCWLIKHFGTDGVDKLAFSYLAGKFESDPLADHIEELRGTVWALLTGSGLARPVNEVRRSTVEIDFAFVMLLARYLEDPDWESLMPYCTTGARLGVGVELPRTPAVWPPKKKWPLPPFCEEEALPLNENYPSARLRQGALDKEVENQVLLGWMLEMTLGQAKARFGDDVTVAAMAVIEEKPGKYRLLHDGSNLVQVNNRVHVRDGEQYPSAADVQSGIHHGDLAPPVLGLSTDVEKAHKQIPMDERDWKWMACSAEPMPEDPKDLDSWRVLVNTMGTYGFNSASSNWACPASILQRLAYYICGLAFIFRFADDFLTVASSGSGRRCTFQFVRFMTLFSLLGVPNKWAKTKGGFKTEFIGYLFLWDKLLGGLSDRRACWLAAWAERIADAGSAEARDLRGGLGRLSFSAALLRFLLPFLGPLYAWVSILAPGAVWPIPAALVILLRWIAGKLKLSTLVSLKLPEVQNGHTLFKADAKAEGDIVVVGGFESPRPGQTLKQCRWFSYALTVDNAPWAFVKHGEAFRAIAALELFATLLCLLLFAPSAGVGANLVLALPCITDNQGNEALVVKNMTTKFPLYLILLELTEQLQLNRWALDLKWQRRDQNQDADDLTNGDFDNFSPALRLDPPLSKLPWLVLPKLFEEAKELHNLISEHKICRKKAAVTAPQGVGDVRGRKRKSVGIKTSDPW
jgi:hypothetical protein